MKVSVFKNGSICYGVDYSKRDNCEKVVEITDDQYSSISKGYSTFDGESFVDVSINFSVEAVSEEERYTIDNEGTDLIIPRRELDDDGFVILKDGGYLTIVDSEYVYNYQE